MQKEQGFKAKDSLEVMLRPARPDDAEGIVAILHSSAPERSYVLSEYCEATHDKCQLNLENLDNSKNLLLVAEIEGKVAGALGAIQFYGGRRPGTEHVLELGIHINEPHRGKGIGTRMLMYAEQWARLHDYKKITASIFTTNLRSLDLFKKAGFEQESIRQMHIRIGSSYIDEVCMVKVLD